MSGTVELQGRCLCGGITVHAKAPLPEGASVPSVSVCHCSMCRTWGGGPLFAVECGTDVRFEGQELVSAHATSDWAERGFCRQCGTHLFYLYKEGGLYALPAGLFGGIELVFDSQIFVEERPHWYAFANRTKEMTGEELFSAHQP